MPKEWIGGRLGKNALAKVTLFEEAFPHEISFFDYRKFYVL
jgi:hypothetical protein